MKTYTPILLTIALALFMFAIILITYNVKPYPKIGRVYRQINNNPFDKHTVKDSVIDIKGNYVQFIEYIDDTIQPGKPSCKIKDFLKDTNN